jgi:hypothetical protein
MIDRILIPPIIGACTLFFAADALPDLLGVVVAVFAAVIVAAHSARP